MPATHRQQDLAAIEQLKLQKESIEKQLQDQQQVSKLF
jgi:hypothetical protein